MKLSVVVIRSWFSKNKQEAEKLSEVLPDFGISAATYDIEDFIEDVENRTGNILKNVLSGQPHMLVCIDLTDIHLEFLVKRTDIPILNVSVTGPANAVGKAALTIARFANASSVV